jgi:hypothetical protein
VATIRAEWDGTRLTAVLLLSRIGKLVPLKATVRVDGAPITGAVWSTADNALSCSPSAVWLLTAEVPEAACKAGSKLRVELCDGALVSGSKEGAPASTVEVEVVAAASASGGGAELAAATAAAVPVGTVPEAELRRALARYVLPSEELITSQLDSCRELLDECEGLDQKWPLLTIVYLLNGLDTAEHREELYQSVAKLQELDPHRTGYYRDLKSRYVCEDHICSSIGQLERGEVADLSARELTSVYHLQFFAFSKRLLLGQNRIRRLDGFSQLLHVAALILDDNDVDGVFGAELRGLRFLKTLSLANNKIATLAGLAGLANLPLTSLALSGNPVTDVESYAAFAAENLRGLAAVAGGGDCRSGGDGGDGGGGAAA